VVVGVVVGMAAGAARVEHLAVLAGPPIRFMTMVMLVRMAARHGMIDVWKQLSATCRRGMISATRSTISHPGFSGPSVAITISLVHKSKPTGATGTSDLIERGRYAVRRCNNPDVLHR
jgi:hypothetical protein